MTRHLSSQNRRLTHYQHILRRQPAADLAARTALSTPEDPAAVVSTHVLAPVLDGFVRWLLREAVRSGRRRLYFLARDGYAPYQAASRYCMQYAIPLDCRYLSCSRYALRIPLFHRDPEQALDSICRSGPQVTLDRLCRRAGLTPPQIAGVLPILSLPFGPQDPIPADRMPAIRERLKHCRPFMEGMETRSRAAFPALASYLRQEGLLDDCPYAIVDSGWVGSIQQTLGELLAILGTVRPLEGYYWGLYDLPAGVRRAGYHPYYFSPTSDLLKKVRFNNSLFEAIYMAPHGMTLGYTQEETGRYRPLYGPIDETQRIFLHQVGEALTAYQEALFGQSAAPVWSEDTTAADQAVAYRLLRAFMMRPTREEAAVFGRLPFSDDVLAGEDRQIAAPLSAKDLRDRHPLQQLWILAGLRRPPRRESAWYAGSVVRRGRAVGYHLGQYTLYQLLRHLRQTYSIRKRQARESSS